MIAELVAAEYEYRFEANEALKDVVRTGDVASPKKLGKDVKGEAGGMSASRHGPPWGDRQVVVEVRYLLEYSEHERLRAAHERRRKAQAGFAELRRSLGGTDGARRGK